MISFTALWLPFEEFELDPEIGPKQLDEISKELMDQKYELSSLYKVMIYEAEDPENIIKTAVEWKDAFRKTKSLKNKCSRPFEIIGYCLAGLADFMEQCHFPKTEIERCTEMSFKFAVRRILPEILNCLKSNIDFEIEDDLDSKVKETIFKSVLDLPETKLFCFIDFHGEDILFKKKWLLSFHPKCKNEDFFFNFLFDDYVPKNGIWMTSENSKDPYFIRRSHQIGIGVRPDLIAVKRKDLPATFIADLVAKLVSFDIDISITTCNFRQALLDHYGKKNSLSPNTQQFKKSKADLIAAIEKMNPTEVKDTLNYVMSRREAAQEQNGSSPVTKKQKTA